MGHDALDFAAWSLPGGKIPSAQARKILAGRITEQPDLFPVPLSKKLARQTLEESRALDGAGSLGSGVAFMDGSLIRGATRCLSAFGLLGEGQDWPSRDGVPVRLVWVLIVKDESPRSVARDLGMYLGGLLGDPGLVDALGHPEAGDPAGLFKEFLGADMAAEKALSGGSPSEALRALDRGLELVPASHRMAEKRAYALSKAGSAGGYATYKRKIS